MTDRFLRRNRYTRPYDDLIPMGRKEAVRARRRDPDGQYHKIGETVRAGHVCNQYPWSKMKNGDFFIVPLIDRTERALRVSFAQAAARLDIELIVCKWKLPNGTHALRVTKVLEGVKALRHAAIERGLMEGTVSDGRWRDRKNAWEKAKVHRASGGQPVQPKPTKGKPPKRDKRDDPFWADKDASFDPVDAPPPEFEPDLPMTREEMIKRALGPDA